MLDKLQFQNKLEDLIMFATENQKVLTKEQIENFFIGVSLSEEQMKLVYDYLLAKKISVKGYVKEEENEEVSRTFTESDIAYLKEYEEEIALIKPEEEGEIVSLYNKIISGDDAAKMRLIEVYLPYILTIAKDMYKEGFYLADLIQEGNVSLIVALESLPAMTIDSLEQIHKLFNMEIRQGIQLLIEETSELRARDQKMVEQVKNLDESITQLTEDIGRKVTIEELALYTEMDEDEILEVLKLTGEEVEEDAGPDFEVREGKME